MQKVRIVYDGFRFLVWDARQGYVLRCAHRIVGCHVGALPTNKRQNSEFGLPLCLLFEEVLLAVEEGFAEAIDVSGLAPAPWALSIPERPLPTNGHLCIFAEECNQWAGLPLPVLAPKQLRLAGKGRLCQAQVYRALWERGHFVTPGSAFGSDYLCYPADPFRHHAHIMVHIAPPGRALRAVELACFARLAASVKKAAFVATYHAGGEVRLLPIEMLGAGTAHMSSQAVNVAARQVELVGTTEPSSSNAAGNDGFRLASACAEAQQETRKARRLVLHSHVIAETWRAPWQIPLGAEVEPRSC